MSGVVLEEQVGFFFVYVKTRRADLAGLDAGEERFRVHQRTARGVQQDHTASALFKRFRVDDVVGVFRQRRVQGDDVALREQLIEGDVADRVAVVKTGRREFVVREHLHSEAAADVDEYPSDASGTDDAHRFSVQIEAGHACQTEIVVSRTDVRFVDAADGGQQECHRVFRNRVGGVRRNAKNVDFSESVLHVHVVEARTAESDNADAHFVQPIDHRRVHGVVDEDTDAVKAVCQFGGVLVQLGFEKFECHTVCLAEPFEGRLVVRLGVKECNFHMVSSLCFF